MVMRKILRILGSRYGIAAILLVAVIVVVSIAKLSTDTNSEGTTNSNDSVDNVDEGDPNDGYVEPSGDSKSSKLPSAAVKQADSFAKAWVDTRSKSQEDWFKEVAKYSTKRVKDQLHDTAPEAVPAKKIQDKPVIDDNNVEIGTDKGLLILGMIKENKDWLVNSIDFENP